MDLKGKVALVTGASSGIGKAIAVALAHKRTHVLVHYGRNKAGAQETLKQVEKFSTGTLYQADLMNPKKVTSLFDEIKRSNSGRGSVGEQRWRRASGRNRRRKRVGL